MVMHELAFSVGLFGRLLQMTSLIFPEELFLFHNTSSSTTSLGIPQLPVQLGSACSPKVQWSQRPSNFAPQGLWKYDKRNLRVVAEEGDLHFSITISIFIVICRNASIFLCPPFAIHHRCHCCRASRSH